MIVTRQRPKKKNRLPILLPIAAILMLVVALSWPPSRRVITSGPFRPITRVVLALWEQVSRPLTFSYQQQQITDRNIQIKQLNDQLEAIRKTASEQDQQVQALQKQIAASNAQPPPVTPTPAPVARPSAAGGLQLAAPVSPEVQALKQTGEEWSAMDPEKAAALISTLPDDYVVKVFAQMPPDDVGDIMDNLSPNVAARIVQASAQLSASVSR